MTYIIDRFEGEFAVLENQDTGKMENVPISAMPKGAKEGDAVSVDESGTFSILPPTPDDEMDDLMKLFE